MLDPKVLAEYVQNSGLSYKQNGVSWIFTCSRCQKDKVYLHKGYGKFTCFYCSAKENFRGRAEFLLSELLNVPVHQVRLALYGEQVKDGGCVSLDLDLADFFGEDDQLTDARQDIPTIAWGADQHPIDHKLAERGATYLTGRGIPLDIAVQYHLRYSPTERRVYFPIELGGKLFGYQGRTVVKETRVWNEELSKYQDIPKVLSSKGIPRDRVVMFGDRLVGYDHAVLCEGPVGAIKGNLCGGNIATMGKIVSKGQLQLLRNHGIQKLYLALDPDAFEETAKLVRDNSDLDLYLMEPDEGFEDLGAMSMEANYEVFKSAEKVNSGRIFVFLKSWC